MAEGGRKGRVGKCCVWRANDGPWFFADFQSGSELPQSISLMVRFHRNSLLFPETEADMPRHAAPTFERGEHPFGWGVDRSYSAAIH